MFYEKFFIDSYDWRSMTMKTITGHTGLTALLGSPVAHSISPMMHNEAFRILGLDYVYLCFDVNEDTLPAAVEGLKTCGIRGFNLTMPNKNKIVELLDELSPEAQLIGAVNTVLNDNGKLTGYNTDGYGFMQSVRDAGHDITGKAVTVMGVGGAIHGNLCTVCSGWCQCSSDLRPSHQPLLGSYTEIRREPKRKDRLSGISS